jgi:hypothetical protein
MPPRSSCLGSTMPLARMVVNSRTKPPVRASHGCASLKRCGPRGISPRATPSAVHASRPQRRLGGVPCFIGSGVIVVRPSEDTTPLSELWRNVVAAAAVFVVVGLGAFVYMNWF